MAMSVAALLGAPGSRADTFNDIFRVSQASTEAAQGSQVRIDKIADETRDLLQEYKTVTKQIGDRQRPGLLPMKGRANVALAETLVLAGGRWTPHDLRRTGATIMVSLGVLPEVAERCLNHTEENKVKRIYQRHSYEVEMREAWRLLGERLELMIRVETNNREALDRVT